MVVPLGFGLGCGIIGCVLSSCPTTLTAMGRPYTFDGILMFHLWYVNIPARQKYHKISEEVAA